MKSIVLLKTPEEHEEEEDFKNIKVPKSMYTPQSRLSYDSVTTHKHLSEI